MKTMIQVVVAVLLTVMLFVYQFSTMGAFSAYKDFADQLCKMKFGDAKKKTLRSAAGDFSLAERFCRQAYATLPKTSYGPRYIVLAEERPAFSTIRLKIEQTVPLDVPGPFSTVVTADVVFVHETEMVLRAGFWKVARFSITKKETGNEEKPIQFPDFALAIQEGYKKSARRAAASVPDTAAPSVPGVSYPPVRSTPSASPAPGFRTFLLKDGSIVQGKVVENNLVYYAVEDENGKQTLIMKDDIAGGAPS